MKEFVQALGHNAECQECKLHKNREMANNTRFYDTHSVLDSTLASQSGPEEQHSTAEDW